MIGPTLRSASLVAGFTAAVLMCATPDAWAWTAYLKVTIGGAVLPRTSAVKGFEGQIEVSAAGQDSQVTVSAQDPRVTDRPRFGPLAVVKRLDTATPRFLRALALGEVATVELTFVKTSSTGVTVPAFRIVLAEALVTRVSVVGDNLSDPLAEQVTFNPSNRITYTGFTDKGTAVTHTVYVTP